MSHNLYAKLDPAELDKYFSFTHEERSECLTCVYGYEEPPTFSAKLLRDSDWLPGHIVDAVHERHSPAQARCLADSIALALANDAPADETELHRYNNAVHWLRYWADQGKGVRGAP